MARDYGSTENKPASTSFNLSSSTELSTPPVSREGGSKVPLVETEEVTGHSRGLARWVSIAATCGLAVGAIAALNNRSAYSIPATESNLLETVHDAQEQATGLGPNFSAVREPSSPTAPTTTASTTTTTATTTTKVHASTKTSPLTFSATNFYHRRDGKPALDYPWLKNYKLIEPYRDTTLSVTDQREGFEYEWVIRQGKVGHTGQVHVFEATGAEVDVVLENLEEHVITLTEVDPHSGEVANQLEEEVMVKYVRREIRTLTDDEKQELFDAMYKLWEVKVEGGNGKELYGEHYADIWAINRLHFKGATGTDICDNFHDGLGFFVSHSLLTNTFEFSLQLVNPKLTVPYWDFTIETSSEGSKDYDMAKPETRSPMLQSSWFGSTDPVDFQVKDGRWAFTEVPSIELNNPDNLRADVYSKMRAPWNINDRKYLTRGLGKNCQGQTTDEFAWTTCETDYNAILEFSDFYSWGWNIAGTPHGTVHIWLGGVLDCDDAYEEIASLVGPEVTSELLLLTMFHRKQLFCYGLFRCEGNVSMDVNPQQVLDDKICGCLDYDLKKGDDYLTVIPYLLKVSVLLADFDEDIKRKVVAVLCSAVTNYGEHSQSSSSLDPIFWPMHPTLERMFDFAVFTEQLTDFTWADGDVIITNPDGTTTTETISLYADDCPGHAGSDIFPFGLLDSDPTGFDVKTGIRGNPLVGNVLTNREVLAAIDPRLNNLPYVYDTFEWAHCATDGYNFDDAWST